MSQQQVLGEIPIGRLRVSIDEDETTVLQSVTPDNSFDNISSKYLPSTTSPDEIIIRQRGRRSSSIFWSPEKIRNSLSPAGSQMTLRSSPRKRLQTSNTKAITPVQCSASTARKLNSKQTNSKDAITSKRLRFEDKPIAQNNRDFPLNLLLKGMSQNQLIAIIISIVKEQPALERKVRNELPIPDIRQMEDQLNNAHKNIYKSLPTSRLATKTDTMSYCRVITHLNSLKKTIIYQTSLLNDSRNWDALLDYALMAWNYVKATPIWDNYSHNVCRRSCFKILSNQLFASLKNGGTLLGEDRITGFSNQMLNMSNDCSESDMRLCIELVNKMICTIEEEKI